jgi:hypothetical protein
VLLWGTAYLYRTVQSLVVFCAVTTVAWDAVVTNRCVALSCFAASLPHSHLTLRYRYRARAAGVVALVAVAWIVTGFVWGTHDLRWACNGTRPTFEHRVITVDLPANHKRLEDFQRRMYVRHGVDNINVQLGEIAVGRMERRVAQTRSIIAAMRETPREADWVVVYEDDAVPLGGGRFVAYLEDAACRYARHDLVWLDTRSTTDWFFGGKVLTGSNAVAFRTAVLADTLAVVQEEKLDQSDIFFPRLCNTGMLKCAFSPLVTSYGYASTRDTSLGDES